jgi:hypothetical protein
VGVLFVLCCGGAVGLITYLNSRGAPLAGRNDAGKPAEPREDAITLAAYMTMPAKKEPTRVKVLAKIDISMPQDDTLPLLMTTEERDIKVHAYPRRDSKAGRMAFEALKDGREHEIILPLRGGFEQVEYMGLGGNSRVLPDEYAVGVFDDD